MSLVFLAADFPPSRGGIQTVAYELPLAIHRSGEAVGVVTVCREGGAEFDESCPYPVVRVPDGPKMQVAANLSAGVSGLKRSPRSHPEWRSHVAGARRWRLLLQVTRDASTECHFATGQNRLYLWVPEDGLRTGDLTSVEAIFR